MTTEERLEKLERELAAMQKCVRTEAIEILGAGGKVRIKLDVEEGEPWVAVVGATIRSPQCATCWTRLRLSASAWQATPPKRKNPPPNPNPRKIPPSLKPTDRAGCKIIVVAGRSSSRDATRILQTALMQDRRRTLRAATVRERSNRDSARSDRSLTVAARRALPIQGALTLCAGYKSVRSRLRART